MRLAPHHAYGAFRPGAGRMSSLRTSSSLRVLLVDDGAHRVADMREELVRLGYEVVGVVDSAPLIHDCVATLAPDVIIIDSESPTRDTLEQLASCRRPRRDPWSCSRRTRTRTRCAGAQGRRFGLYRRGHEGRPPGADPRRRGRALRAGERIARRTQETHDKLAERKLIERAKGIVMKQRTSARRRRIRICASSRWIAAASSSTSRSMDHRAQTDG